VALYAHDVATLRLVDARYRLGHYDRFSPCAQGTLWSPGAFLDHAGGDLAAVSWIDPNFVTVGGWSTANDDHPPSDLMAGQVLVLQLYTAVVNSPAWAPTLIVMTYDEQVGLYDHVASPAAAALVVELVAWRLPPRYGFGPGEVEVLAPMHRGDAGVTALNLRLQQRLNPERGGRRRRGPAGASTAPATGCCSCATTMICRSSTGTSVPSRPWTPSRRR
jgi:Phosphoesterase family